jgi:alpha-glucoside transport system substrate-binding protein
MLKRNALWPAMILMVIVSMLVGACAQATPAPTSEAPAAPAATEAPAVAVTFTFVTPPIPGGALEQALQGKFKGTTVTMDGPFSSDDQVKFNESVKAFQDATGITINYIGGKEFEAHIRVSVEGGSPPDIADFPQPGLLANFVKEGKVVDLTTVLPADYLKQQYKQAWLDMGTMQGPNGPITAGVWARYNGKSQVWYPKAEFDKAGYKVPTTWDEMMTFDPADY